MARKHGCKLSVVDCKRSKSRDMSLLVEIEGVVRDDFISELKSTKEIKRVYFAKKTPTKTLVMLILEPPVLCNIAKESNTFCVSCPYNSQTADDCLEWNLFVKDANDVAKVTEALEFYGSYAVIKSIENAKREDPLTHRQKEILFSALKSGYFEFPRHKTLTELANELSIKPSSLSENLRRIELKIAKAYVDGLDQRE